MTKYLVPSNNMESTLHRDASDPPIQGWDTVWLDHGTSEPSPSKKLDHRSGASVTMEWGECMTALGQTQVGACERHFHDWKVQEAMVELLMACGSDVP